MGARPRAVPPLAGVAVIVPRFGSCPYREAAWQHCKTKYTHPVIEAVLADGPWVKANAVMPAVRDTNASIVVVADADVWCDGLELAIDHVRQGAPWAVPHRRVKRLNQKSTARVLTGEPPERLQLEEPSYVGALAGGLFVIPRTTLLDIPMDPRFVGWGGEDRAHGWALCLLAGEPWRGDVNLWHLAHPPQERADRNHGSPETEALRKRYIAARQDATKMRALLDEIGDAWTRSPLSPTSTSG